MIDDGVVFEGPLDQFKDCFISNANDKTIQEWCNQQGYKFETYILTCEYCKKPIDDLDELVWDKRNSKPYHRECSFQQYPGSRPLEFKKEELADWSKEDDQND